MTNHLSMKVPKLLIITLCALCSLLSITYAQTAELPAASSLRCAPVISDHAILQQGFPIHLWGWAEQGARVTVELGEDKQSTTATDAGEWSVNLTSMPADKLDDLAKAPEGRSLIITSDKGGKTEKLTFKHILIGEVWLCSGQSNMAGKVKNNFAAQNPNDNLSKLNLPAIRQYHHDLGWTSATPGPVLEFTRVGLSFARRLQQELKVPVGILSASVGGTPIESWIRPGDITLSPNQTFRPGNDYLQYIVPLISTAMRGTLWYQGEGNAADGLAYFPKLETLIKGWREEWKQPEMPFLVVQLAGIGTDEPKEPAMAEGRAHIRQAQFQILDKIPHTGLATAIDIGGPREHPANKNDIGLRLAHWALHHQYGLKQITPCGPL
jgi:sialate O-acetylesterase